MVSLKTYNGAVQANLVTDDSFNAPKGWTYSQPVLDVQNATVCNVTVTYSHSELNATISGKSWLPTEEHYNGRLQAVVGGGVTPGRFILSYAEKRIHCVFSLLAQTP